MPDITWEGEEFEDTLAIPLYNPIETWENEGGPVVDDEWEPSESEVFMTETPVDAKYSEEETQYKFTCLIAEGIRHVNKFFFTRKQQQPSMAEQIGEFVTEIRRQVRGPYVDLVNCGFRDLTDTEVWLNVAVPEPKRDYRWWFLYKTTQGVCKMTLPKAQTLCENAVKMATSDKTTDEEFREINSALNDLMRETTALDSLVYKARDISAQASTVVDNLCVIAEKLQES